MDIETLSLRVRSFVTQEVPALATGRALLAVSGGADSIATASLLCEATVIEPSRAFVAHFDHRLRGTEAAALDRLAVEALCTRYGLDLLTGYWHDPRNGEARAREARYSFLREGAAHAGAQVLVTGHTSNDHAETVFMHAMRGAGLHGLRGILPQSRAHGVTLARPLLCISRDETRAYCEARDLTFVDDETNGETSLLRNKVRLQLLPAMEAASPGARAALLQTAREAAEAVSAIEEIVSDAVGNVSCDDIVMQKEQLQALPRAVLPYALRLAIERLLGDARDLDRRHYARLSQALEARTGTTFELPRKLKVYVDAREVVINRAPAHASIAEGFVATVPFSGRVGMWDLQVSPAEGRSSLMLPAGAVVRGRRPGDRMRLRAGSKKLQDVLVDHKVPRRLRDNMPVIASGGDVLWTPFVGAPTAGQGLPHEVTAVPMFGAWQT